jgi:hypothetical protein
MPSSDSPRTRTHCSSLIEHRFFISIRQMEAMTRRFEEFAESIVFTDPDGVQGRQDGVLVNSPIASNKAILL